MKKLLIMVTALMAVAVFSATSFAAGTVQMTLTSPVIYKAGCEKVGSTTYEFDEGSVIRGGDWWYMDLPENVTLCKDYDFVIVGKGGGVPNVGIDFTNANWSTNVGFNNSAAIGDLAPAGNDGPVYASGAGVGTTVAVGDMAFLVRGTEGQRRITIYAIADDSAATMSVEANSELNIKLFDGNAHSDTTSVNANHTAIVLDRDGDGSYGELSGAVEDINLDEVIGGDASDDVTAGEPYVENTLCVNAEEMSGQYLFTSYASRLDRFTFTGDSQIAHTGTAATISLADCKGETEENIEIGGGQGASCWFEYDDDAEDSYCSDFANKLLIETASGAFGDIDDRYFVTLEITSPSDGVYFGGDPEVYAYTSADDACDDTVVAESTSWNHYDGATKLTSFSAGDTDCAVGSDNRSDYVKQTNTMTLNDADTVWVDMPQFNYTSASVAAGEVVTVEVTLNRYPCGEIFSDTLDIGTFVTGCSGASSTTLYFPWLPGTGAAGWWGGFVITNVGDTPGVATLTYSDSTGAQATLTTDSVAAGAQWVNSEVTADDLTDVDDDSPFDMSLNHSVTAACGFQARGFAFTGNGTEGTGYLADN